MKIAVISIKGGVVKTTISINLASILRKKLGYKVIILDFNKNNNQTLLFIGRKYPIVGERLWQGIMVGKYFHLKIVNDINQYFEEDLKYLERIYDFIIFDIPNDLNYIQRLEKYADKILLVTTPDIFSIIPNYHLYNLLGRKDNTILVVNKYNKEMDLEMIYDMFSNEIGAVLRYDKRVFKSNMYGIPVVYYDKGKFLEDMYDLVTLLTGKKIKRGLLKSILSIFE